SGGLKRNIVVRDAYIGIIGLTRRSALIVAGCVRFGVSAAARFAAAALAAEKGQFVDQNLRLVALLAGFFVVPRAGLDLAFDEELRAFFDVVADDLGRTLKADQIVPLGLVGPVALSVFLTVGSGEGKAGDGHAAGGGTDLGVFAHIAQKEYLVDTFSHNLYSGFKS